MIKIPRPRIHTVLSLLLGVFLALPATAETASEAADCRIAFDMGSSGIRAGMKGSTHAARRSLDALAPLWAGRGIAAIESDVINALRELPRATGGSDRCARVGGGFSAWRLALQQDSAALADSLARIHAQTGVTVLVMPPRQEGAYGYHSARQMLGKALTTTHILDIGGGSFQVAGERDSLALPLGQKSWHRALCDFLRGTGDVPCRLQPLGDRELTRARALIAVRLAAEAAPAGMTLTAISRPVTRGAEPAVRRLQTRRADRLQPMTREEISGTIDKLAVLDLPGTTGATGSAESHAAFLLSDLILIEAITRLTVDQRLRIAETDLDNLPGLLADEHAFAWHGRDACYRGRLRSLGLEAYYSDPASCLP